MVIGPVHGCMQLEFTVYHMHYGSCGLIAWNWTNDKVEEGN